MKKILHNTIILSSFFILPELVFAQVDIDATGGINTLLASLAKFVMGRVFPLLILLGLVYTVYAGVQYIAVDPDSNQRDEKRKHLISGIVGLFVIVSVWSLVALIGNTFNIFAGGTLRP